MAKKDFSTVIQLINKHKINNVMLADLLGIGRSFFSEKMNNKRYSKFSDEQQQKIIAYLKEMGKELSKIN